MSWDQVRFRDLSRSIHHENLTVFGEYFLWQPRVARPNRPSLEDTSRGGSRRVCMIFTDFGRVSEDFNNQMKSPSGIEATMPRAEVHADQFGGHEVHQGDLFTREEGGSVDSFEVTRIQRMEHNLVKLYFVQLGTQSRFKPL